MSTPIHLTITCTDCFKGVSCCSGNTDDRRLVYENGKLKEPKSGFLSKLSRKKHDKLAENALARQQFETFLAEKYNVDASALSQYCGEGCWSEKMHQRNPLTRGELAHLVEAANALSPEELRTLKSHDPLPAQSPKWTRHPIVQEALV